MNFDILENIGTKMEQKLLQRKSLKDKIIYIKKEEEESG